MPSTMQMMHPMGPPMQHMMQSVRPAMPPPMMHPMGLPMQHMMQSVRPAMPPPMMQSARPAMPPPMMQSARPAMPPPMMQSARPAMQPKEVTFSDLLSDKAIFNLLCDIVLKGGINAVKDATYLGSRNTVCALPIEYPYIFRSTVPLKHTFPTPIVNFAPEDICFVGGSALQLYNQIFDPDFRGEYTVQTQDIDAVWWPRITMPPDFSSQLKEHGTFLNESEFSFPIGIPPDKTQPHYTSDKFRVVIFSPPIRAIANALKATIQSLMDSRKSSFLTKITELRGVPTDPSYLDIVVDTAPNELSGTINVFVTMRIGDKTTKLLEIAIHDGASSQETELMNLEEVQKDPLYMQETTINIVPYPVPFLDKFIQQQYLGLKNRIQKLWRKPTHPLAVAKWTQQYPEIMAKVFMHHNRILYIKSILDRVYDGSHSRSEAIVRLPKEFYDRFSVVLNTMLQSDDFLASCPNTKEVCVSESQKDKFRALCEAEKVIKKELCTSGGAKTRKSSKTTRSRNRRRPTRRTLLQ